MKRVLCSTGTMLGRPNGRDFTLLPDICEKLKCDGLEFLMYDTWYDKITEIKSTMKRVALPVYVFHLEKTIGELISYGKLDLALERMETNCALARDLGADVLVLHLWNGIISDKNIDFNIECYDYLVKIAEKYHLALTVENVICSEKDPMHHLCTLIEKYPHIKFTFDTKMADFHKQLDLLYREEYRHVVGHIAHIHANDYLGGYKDFTNLRVLPIGKGDIDFDRFFAFIKESGYRGDFTTEATAFDKNGIINIQMLNEAIHTIRGLIK